MDDEVCHDCGKTISRRAKANVWNGLEAWKRMSALFTLPELCEGRLELRDFGQGDGTYRPPLNGHAPFP